MSIAELTHQVEVSEVEICEEVSPQDRNNGCNGRTESRGSHEEEISLFNMSFIGH